MVYLTMILTLMLCFFSMPNPLIPWPTSSINCYFFAYVLFDGHVWRYFSSLDMHCKQHKLSRWVLLEQMLQ